MYQGVYPLSAALSRPLIAHLLVETAHKYGAAERLRTVVPERATTKCGSSWAYAHWIRTSMCRAPLREQPLSRPDAIAFAAEHGVPVSHTAEKPYSIDANLWGRSIEAGVLEDPWNAPPEDAYAWTASPHDRPPSPDEIVIEFSDGLPLLDGKSGWELVAHLNALAGKHGVGRIDLVEDRVVGLKSREVYECPGSIVLDCGA